MWSRERKTTATAHLGTLILPARTFSTKSVRRINFCHSWHLNLTHYVKITITIIIMGHLCNEVIKEVVAVEWSNKKGLVWLGWRIEQRDGKTIASECGSRQIVTLAISVASWNVPFKRVNNTREFKPLPFPHFLPPFCRDSSNSKCTNALYSSLLLFFSLLFSFLYSYSPFSCYLSPQVSPLSSLRFTSSRSTEYRVVVILSRIM